jgi:hypothetical protein
MAAVERLCNTGQGNEKPSDTRSGTGTKVVLEGVA